jgi:DNA-binding NtrC family response regulator
MKKVLASTGYSVEIALTAADGLNRMETGLFRLVLLDIMMPKVNGITLLKIIKRRWSNLKVLMVTGYPSIDTAVEATQLGAVDYIPKPFTPDELRKKVEEVLSVSPSFCPQGMRVCEVFSKQKRECKTKDGRCPMEKEMERKSLAKLAPFGRGIGKSGIATGMPIHYLNEVARCASQTYVDALDISGMPMVDWNLLPSKAPDALGEILVVDDEVVVGNSIRKILEPRGYHVDHVETPQGALNILSERAVDIILLDLRIPGVKGLDLLETITSKYPSIPVVMITGYATVKTAVESIKLGAADYVPKPFTPDEIHEAVERGLEEAA